MRYAVLFILVMAVGCQPAIRFTSDHGRPVSKKTTQSPDNDHYTYNSGAVDKDRMSKVIAGYLYTPYKLGGTGKLGIDCSGLVYVVYRDYNSTRLPANTDKLFNRLKRVNYKDIAYGDLVFFSFDGSDVSHVGIYVGHDKFVHASKSRGVVITKINDEYYRSAYKGARRVVW